MTNTNKSMMDEAIDSAGTRAWILRTVLDNLSMDDAAVPHALRNVRCDAIRAAIAAVPADATLKIPTRRTDVITLACRVVRHLRAYGFVATELA